MGKGTAGQTIERAVREAASGNADRARALLSQALDEGADAGEVHLQLGRLELSAGELEEAADLFELAVHFDPRLGQAWLHLSAIRLRQARFGDALEAAKRALPGAGAGGYSNLALALRGSGRFDEAVQVLERALELDPDSRDARANLGLLLRDQGKIDQAIAHLEWVLERDPADGVAAWNLAVMRLASGNFRAAWADYELRWLQPDAVRRNFDFPRWDGSPLAGRTLLIYAEQGLGDEIMFASCVPEIFAAGGAVVLECSPRLAALFRRSFPAVTVIEAFADRGPDWLERLPRIDCQVAIGSLPRVLNLDRSDFPRSPSYLKAHQAQIERWRSALKRIGPGLKIGLCWRGGAPQTGGLLRSLDVAQLEPLWRLPGCHFVSLQHGATEEYVAAADRDFGAKIHCWPGIGHDMDETAGLIQALDIVVSVTTTVVHLAGALGQTAWAMVPVSAEWRYQAAGERMPWYPSVRLFRQPASNAWSSVVEAIARELAAHGR